MELNVIVDKKLCVTPCLLCGSLCNKKNYTELRREDTENHRDKKFIL